MIKSTYKEVNKQAGQEDRITHQHLLALIKMQQSGCGGSKVQHKQEVSTKRRENKTKGNCKYKQQKQQDKLKTTELNYAEQRRLTLLLTGTP